MIRGVARGELSLVRRFSVFGAGCLVLGLLYGFGHEGLSFRFVITVIVITSNNMVSSGCFLFGVVVFRNSVACVPEAG